jgi:hypothetical protein
MLGSTSSPKDTVRIRQRSRAGRGSIWPGCVVLILFDTHKRNGVAHYSPNKNVAYTFDYSNNIRSKSDIMAEANLNRHDVHQIPRSNDAGLRGFSSPRNPGRSPLFVEQDTAPALRMGLLFVHRHHLLGEAHAPPKGFRPTRTAKPPQFYPRKMLSIWKFGSFKS